jgi:hypothetical protein
MALNVFLNDVASALGNPVPDSPFGSQFRIPLPAARSMDFFNRRYVSTDTWRQIDGAWLEGSPQLALQLDSATNNTSLVLAIELANGDVLLFAADAQVGAVVRADQPAPPSLAQQLVETKLYFELTV